MKRIIIAALVIVASASIAPTAYAEELPLCDYAAGFVSDCIEPQLPEETNGRAIDCPDGQVGYTQDGMVVCPPAAVAEVPDVDPPVLAPIVPVPSVPDTPATPPAAEPHHDPAAPTFDLAAFVRELFARIFGWLFT